MAFPRIAQIDAGQKSWVVVAGDGGDHLNTSQEAAEIAEGRIAFLRALCGLL